MVIHFITAAVASAYVWMLPLMTGFTKAGSHSISGFIATPGATGAMAVAFAGPFMAMLALEDATVVSPLRKASFWTFVLGFAGFLIFCVDDFETLHYTSVGIFVFAFTVHALYRARETKSSLGWALIVIGVTAFLIMVVIHLLADTIWFWAAECAGFTALLFFTPVELKAAAEDTYSRPHFGILGGGR